jgi:hypothetical protein
MVVRILFASPIFWRSRGQPPVFRRFAGQAEVFFGQNPGTGLVSEG